ncbi:MAG TPA: beta-ketoacyl-[acyl-carrier-protein] synthase family protein [Gemmatimonadetes bacterium]|nr:beta-ketoacyl-[acyl-carrier-protein] synthase family protein [Gemmatimonadota bacterium]
MNSRVVVTGLGVVAPNGVGLIEYSQALRAGKSGIRHVPVMEESKFGCTVGGIPQGVDAIAEDYFTAEDLMAMNTSHRYGCIAAMDAWTDAGFERPSPDDDEVCWDAGAVIGSGIGGLDTAGERLIPFVDSGRVRRLGSTMVEQIMGSGPSARVAGLLALGNQVTANSSACSTGTEAILEGYRRIQSGRARRMLCGGTEGSSHYIWAGFDAMRVLSRKYNDEPTRASRPLSASAAGFVPSSGAGVLLLENLEDAESRGARIYGEILGGAVNCGGHRRGGSMTAPNPDGVQMCIRRAVEESGIGSGEIDAINGHLTATGADSSEVLSWAKALELSPEEFPLITSTKSMIGHALGAAGALEVVACMLMLDGGFVHPSINCEDVHPKIEEFAGSIPQTVEEVPQMKTIIKAGFGFGDVNVCAVFRKWLNN